MLFCGTVSCYQAVYGKIEPVTRSRITLVNNFSKGRTSIQADIDILQFPLCLANPCFKRCRFTVCPEDGCQHGFYLLLALSQFQGGGREILMEGHKGNSELIYLLR